MAVAFQDYYKTLGVARDATPEQIQAAYRKLARKHHPDVSKEADAEERFKQINEAYEVLRDPQKRKQYDALGADWRAGQEFTPPPGSGPGPHVEYRTVDPQGFDFGGFGGAGGFSDFFESLFGRADGRPGERRQPRPTRGNDAEGEVTVSLEEAYHGTTRTLQMVRPEIGPDGQVREATASYEVRIPPGTAEGAVLRLSGQGGAGIAGGPAGDVYIRVHLAPHPRFRVEGRDLVVEVSVAPWEAALGAEIPVPTLDGEVQMKLPPGTGSGRRLRLRGQGLPQRNGQRADLYAVVRIDVPRTLTERERALFEELRGASEFRPRG